MSSQGFNLLPRSVDNKSANAFPFYLTIRTKSQTPYNYFAIQCIYTYNSKFFKFCQCFSLTFVFVKLYSQIFSRNCIRKCRKNFQSHRLTNALWISHHQCATIQVDRPILSNVLSAASLCPFKLLNIDLSPCGKRKLRFHPFL